MSASTQGSYHRKARVYLPGEEHPVHHEKGLDSVEDLVLQAIPGVGTLLQVKKTDGELITYPPGTIFELTEKPSPIEIPKIKLTP